MRSSLYGNPSSYVFVRYTSCGNKECSPRIRSFGFGSGPYMAVWGGVGTRMDCRGFHSSPHLVSRLVLLMSLGLDLYL